MMNPIKPTELAAYKSVLLPDAVIQSFNELIAEKFADGRAVVEQRAVVARMVLKGLDRDDIYAHGYLDVEEIYRATGWKVKYDKPGYNEGYEANFTFSTSSLRASGARK